MFSFSATRFPVSRFLDPGLLALAALGALLYFAFRGARPADKWARRARVGAWVVWAVTWLLSMPATAMTLTHMMETKGPDLDVALAGRDPQKTALVVLSAGISTYDPTVPLRERMDGASTKRVLAAIRLWRTNHFGLVIVTGTPAALPVSMKDLLVYGGVPPDRVAIEDHARNTRENALFSAEILRARGIETVVVVTSATHLSRAVRDFARAGIQAIPAAADVRGLTRMGLDTLLPSASGLAVSHVVLHEILGRLQR